MNKSMLKKSMLMLMVAGMGLAGRCETIVFSSASSEAFVLDTTFEEGSEISNRLEIAYGNVGSGACRVEVDGEPQIESAGSGTMNWTTLTEGEHTFVWQSADGAMTTTVNVVELVWPPSPVISPASGMTFDSSLTVTMSCAMDGASIFYTEDGHVPTMESNPYKRFKISSKTTVKAVAYRDGYYSDVATSEYALGQCADPSVSPADDTVFTHSGLEVSIAQNGDEGVLRYTLDGSDPTAASPVYTGPFTVDDTTVVKAKVFSDRYFDSAVVTVNLTRDWETVATPVITAAAEFTGSETKVEIDCATSGATIRYTTNGSEPNSHSTKYTGPFWVNESCTVKAYALCNDYLNSEISTFVITKHKGIGDTMGAPDHVFTTSGDAGFFRVEDATAPGGEAMRSGDVGDSAAYGLYARSVLSTMVRGPGTLAFSWRSSCEQDDDYEWDHAELAVDGVVVAQINDVTDWRKVTQTIEGPGEHVVTWTYLKDDAEKEGDDCMWVAGYSWTPAEPWTHESSVPVPYDWILSYLPHTAPEYERFEAAVREFAANGVNSVEEAYVAGLDPTDALSQLTADITMTNDVPYVTWSPNLNTNGEVRVYKVWGKARLDDADEKWTCPTNGTHRFFKVSVEMK